MADLIDRESLLDIVGKMPIDWEYGRAVFDIYVIIKTAKPVDAVPVVRCRDCEYRKHDITNAAYYCDNWDCCQVEVRENDFCSLGERKDND